MPMQTDVEIWCDGHGCVVTGFAGSYYSFTEIRNELKENGWILKRRGEEINKWWFFCPNCQSKEQIDRVTRPLQNIELGD